MTISSISAAMATIISSGIAALPALGQTAVPPYQLSVFAAAPSDLTAPDSIAVLRDHVFVGYGDGNKPDGSDGKKTQIVEYAMDGTVAHTYSVHGHNDGLKVDPSTHLLWALQNEDANAGLVIINPKTHQQKAYTFGAALHGGGYDDIVFSGCKVFISASNPANNPNTGPAIVSARLDGNLVDVKPMLAGDAGAIDIPTDAPVKLNLQDPDSMTLDPVHRRRRRAVCRHDRPDHRSHHSDWMGTSGLDGQANPDRRTSLGPNGSGSFRMKLERIPYARRFL